MIAPVSLQITYQHILVPVDFSDLCSSAIDYAKAIGRHGNAQLFLVHVTPPVNMVNPPEAAWVDPGAFVHIIEERLEKRGEELRAEGFRVGTLCVTGSVQDEIVGFAQREKVDLIVLGSHDKTGFERLMFGSDAEAVLRHVRCPVITVGPGVMKPSDSLWRPANVVCATALHPDNAGTAEYAYLLAQQFGARFALLTVMSDKSRSYSEEWEAFTRAFKRRLGADASFQPHARTLFSDRSPGFEIAEYSKKHAVDLIVMGAHTASSLATHFAPGTCGEVFAEAPCPVMTVHEP